MGRPEDTAALVRDGLHPGEIAARLGITLSSVLSYLDTAVGRGYLRRSDVYFSFPHPLRQKHAQELARYNDPRWSLGDMYADICWIETGLHAKIRETLVESFGSGEDWWRRGVPENVRVKCQERRERDADEPCEPYGYTDLLDLGKILEEQWGLFKSLFPSVYGDNRKLLLEHLARLNRVRNKVMHPVRGILPCEEDLISQSATP